MTMPFTCLSCSRDCSLGLPAQQDFLQRGKRFLCPLCSMVSPSHMWLLSSWYVGSVSKELDF